MVTAADSMPNLTGHVLDNRFDLLEIFGSGTFGVVYKALDLRSSSSSPIYRAVKIMRKAGRKPHQLTTIRREVALHSTISHQSGVVSLIDAYDDNDHFYMIMNLCSGGDLHNQICGKRVYEGNNELLRKAFLSLIEAVRVCHDEKIAHCDLKPGNILASEDGSELYLADFGLATNKRMIEDFCRGTPTYMSPECVGKMYDFKPYCTRTSDVWALGIVLINMITGCDLWKQPTTNDSSFRKFLKDPDYLLNVLPISPGANTILRRILTLNPLKRITLTNLRDAIISLDTFFCPVEAPSRNKAKSELILPPLPTNIKVVATPVARGKLESATQRAVPEIDIRRTPIPAGRSSEDCSARSAVHSSTTVGNSNSRPGLSCASSEDSRSILVTPDGTTPVMRGFVGGAKEIDWRKGSTAHILMGRYKRIQAKQGYRR